MFTLFRVVKFSVFAAQSDFCGGFDTMPDDQCVVTRSEKAAWIKGNKLNAVTDTVLLYRNCNATVASPTSPGKSAASPEGRAAIAAANAAAAQGQTTAAANQNHPKH